MAVSEPQELCIHAAAPPMVAAEVSTGAVEVAADAWTKRSRRNEISFLGNRVEELERTLKRRTVLLGSATALCLAAALALEGGGPCRDPVGRASPLGGGLAW